MGAVQKNQSTSATWMALPCLFEDDSAVTADLHSLTVVLLVRCHELDAAVAVLLL
jgi:hypothetical protein